MRFHIQEKGRSVLCPPGPPSAGSVLTDKGRKPESWGRGERGTAHQPSGHPGEAEPMDITGLMGLQES